MRKIIAAINMTLDGIFDHTAVDADQEIHQHYQKLLEDADVILYGRKTYQLMQFWPTLLENPSGEPSMDDFAKAIDQIPKLVFSHTLKDLGWDSARLADRSLEEEVLAIKQQDGRDSFVGSRSLIIQLINLKLIDELQICVHPIIAGSGSPLFEQLNGRTKLQLIKTKTFTNGAIIMYYKVCQ